MKYSELEGLDTGHVVMDNSGYAWQKQEDGSWLLADTAVEADMSQYEPFTRLQPDVTPWEFPSEVEEVLDEYNMAPIVALLRQAMARARLVGSYAAFRDDYLTASKAVCDAADLLESEGFDGAVVKRLREICSQLGTPHDE